MVEGIRTVRHQHMEMNIQIEGRTGPAGGTRGRAETRRKCKKRKPGGSGVESGASRYQGIGSSLYF